MTAPDTVAPSSQDRIRAIRADLLDSTLRLGAFVGLLVLAGAVMRWATVGVHPGVVGQALMATWMLLLYLLRQRLSYNTLVALLIVPLFLTGLNGQVYFGQAGIGLYILVLVIPVLCCIFVSGWLGMVSLFVGLAAVSVVAWLWVSGRFAFGFDIAEYLASAVSWISLLINIFSVTLFLIMALSVLLNRIQRVLAAEQTANETLRRQEAELRNLNVELERRASTDSMTGVWNRGHFIVLAEQALAQAQRYQQPLSVLMIDIDHFKKINDHFGHAAGDEAIKALVKLSLTELRDVDFVGRLGGEEFAIVLPQTSLDHAFAVAERLRCRVEEMSLRGAEGIKFNMTISGGIAFAGVEEDLDQLLARADGALYQAKNAGRNRIIKAK